MNNKNNRKTLFTVLTIILVSIFGLTVVYAALSTVLNISGNAEVVASSWDIYLDNVKVTNGSVSTDVPSIRTNNSLEFTTTLNTPGDYYEFTVDVVNNGTIDAMISNIVKTPDLTSEQAKYFKYEVTYQDGSSLNNSQVLSNNSSKTVKVRLEYRKDLVASDLPTVNENFDLALTLEYVQSDNSTSNNNGGVSGGGTGSVEGVVANGDINDIGTIVTIGTEQFYTIGTEGDNVKLLSMYNLYVGGTYDGNSFVPYGTEATGMQDSRMIGEFDGYGEANPLQGITPFADESFRGTNPSDYSASLAEYYVNNYKAVLQSYGVSISEARLLYKEEAEDINTFNCVEYETCSDNYPWIYSTSYWLGTPIGENALWFINTRKMFINSSYDNDRCYGIRPVIVISKDYF